LSLGEDTSRSLGAVRAHCNNQCAKKRLTAATVESIRDTNPSNVNSSTTFSTALAAQASISVGQFTISRSQQQQAIQRAQLNTKRQLTKPRAAPPLAPVLQLMNGHLKRQRDDHKGQEHQGQNIPAIGYVLYGTSLSIRVLGISMIELFLRLPACVTGGASFAGVHLHWRLQD
jgi:hypothetical protein